MRDIIKESFSINLSIMRALRFYPGEKDSYLYKIHGFVMYFICIIFVPTLIIVKFLMDENFDILQLNYNFMFVAEAVSWIIKLLPFLVNGQQIKKCIHYFGDPYFALPKDDKHKRILDDCVKICSRNSFVFLTGCIISYVSFVTAPLFSKGYNFTLDLWLPFDATSGPTVYYSVYIFITITILYPAIGGTLVDPLIGGLAYHATGQIKILKDNLQHLYNHVGKETENSNNHNSFNQKTIKFKIMYDQMKKCIDHHNAILTFVKEYEDCFSLAVLSQFIGSVVAICFCCLQLSMMELFSVSALFSSIYICVILGQIFFYCFYGTLLYEENYSLTNGICTSNWYEYDAKTKKALITLLERSQRPMLITAGKILPLTLETFTMMLKRTYSLLAVLKNYQ